MRHWIVVGLLAACSSKAATPPAAGSAEKPTNPGSGSATDTGMSDMHMSSATKPIPPGLGDGPPALDHTVGKTPRMMKPRRFRHSSVRGDFRIYKTAVGIVTSWRTELSARDLDGKPLWRYPDSGRAVAVSADGTRIVTNNNDGAMAVLDATTGKPIATATLGGHGDAVHPDLWISAFAWTPDAKHVIALGEKEVFVLKADLSVEHTFKLACTEECYFHAAVALSNTEALVTTNRSEGEILRVDLTTGAIGARASTDSHDLDLSSDGKKVLTDGFNSIALLDTQSLEADWHATIPGNDGVAFYERDATEAWKPMPKLSHNGKYIAINDTAGSLWLLSAADGKPVINYPPALIDFVEDVMWLGNNALVAIDNDGSVKRIQGTPAAAAWSQQDAPADGKFDDP